MVGLLTGFKEGIGSTVQDGRGKCPQRPRLQRRGRHEEYFRTADLTTAAILRSCVGNIGLYVVFAGCR
jgi:hypothetical protein